MKTNLKKLVLAAALLAGMVASADAKNVVWDDVVVGYHTTDEFTFKRVELTDTATIVIFDFDYAANRKYKFPKSTHLVTDGGQQLKLLRMEGCEIGRWITSDGTTQHYVMHFEAAPKGCRWLHYVEGEKPEPNAWFVGYIRSSKQSMVDNLPAEWRKMKYERRTPLPEIHYAPDSAYIRVRAINYDPVIGAQVYYSGNSFVKAIHQTGMPIVNFDENGEALLRFQIPFAMEIQIYFGRNGSGALLVQPGETAECLVDLSAEKTRILHCKGAMANLNREIAQPECLELVKVFASDESLSRLAQCTSVESRLACLDSLLDAGTSAINRSPWSEATRAYLRMKLEYGYCETLRDFASDMAQYYRNTHRDVPMNQARWDSLKMVFRDQLPTDVGTRHLAGKALEINWSPSAAMLGRRFFALAAANTKDAKGITNQLNYELRRAYQCMQEVNYADSVLTTIHDDGIRQLLGQMRQEEERILAEIKSKKNVFYHDMDDVAPSEILSTILDRYKGSVVLVDVWESWCVPCRRGHEQMAPVKKELADRNIRYVYLSSLSSDPEKWNELIADIDGDHYYLTKEQNRAVADAYHSTAVPTYVIYDAEGKIIYNQRGVNTKKLREQLLKATE